MPRRLILPSLALVAALAIGRALLGSTDGEGDATVAEVRALPVETMTITQDDHYVVTRSYSGILKTRRSSELGFDRTGRVISLLVNEGRQVEPGQELAVLDSRRAVAQKKELQARRSQAEARLDELLAGPREEAIRRTRSNVKGFEEELSLLELKRKRAERLLAERVVSENEFDEAVSEEKQVAARLDAAREELEELVAGTRNEQIRAQEALIEQLDASLELAQVEVDESILTAPFGGIVAASYLDEGDIASRGAPVLKLVESGRLEAWVGLPENAAKEIVPGTTYQLDIAGDSHTSTAVALLPEVDRATRTVTAVFEVATTTDRIKPGQLARIDIERRVDERGYWVPATALTQGVRGLWNCLVVEQDGVPDLDPNPVVAYRQVEVLHSSDDRLYVRGTISDGDLLVSSGTHRLAPGQTVTLLSAGS